jgi:hypothetical protein
VKHFVGYAIRVLKVRILTGKNWPRKHSSEGGQTFWNLSMFFKFISNYACFGLLVFKIGKQCEQLMSSRLRRVLKQSTWAKFKYSANI